MGEDTKLKQTLEMQGAIEVGLDPQQVVLERTCFRRKGALRLRLFVFWAFLFSSTASFAADEKTSDEEAETLLALHEPQSGELVFEAKQFDHDALLKLFASGDPNYREEHLDTLAVLEHGDAEIAETLESQAEVLRESLGAAPEKVQKLRFSERVRAYFQDSVNRTNTVWVLVRWAVTGSSTAASVYHWGLLATIESDVWRGVAIGLIGAGTGAMSAGFQFLNKWLNRISSTHYVTGSQWFRKHFPNWVVSPYNNGRSWRVVRQETVNLVEQFGKWSILDIGFLSLHEVLKVVTVVLLGAIDVGAHVQDVAPVVAFAALKEVFIQAGFDSSEHASSARKVQEATRRGDMARVRRVLQLNQAKIVLISAITTGLAALDVVYHGQNPVLNGTFLVAGSMGWMWYLYERFRSVSNSAPRAQCASFFQKNINPEKN